jgi:putative FmdB family regulatory protein
MPTYEYACAECGGFQAFRPVAEAAAAQACPACGEPSPRALASPHVRTGRAAIRYVAEARNERSANEPAVEHRLKGTTGQHRAHAHAHHGHSHATHNHRPWMIGH